MLRLLARLYMYHVIYVESLGQWRCEIPRRDMPVGCTKWY